jgi:plasmid stabilization system protein ParE
MTLKLNIVPRAERDAQRIFDWIAERSPDGAIRWYAALENAARKLILNPEAYGLAPEDEHVDLRASSILVQDATRTNLPWRVHGGR